MHITQAVYLPWADFKSKYFNTSKNREGKAFVLEFHLEKQTSGHSLKGIATPVVMLPSPRVKIRKTTNHFHSTRRKLYASDETLHCASWYVVATEEPRPFPCVMWLP